MRIRVRTLLLVLYTVASIFLAWLIWTSRFDIMFQWHVHRLLSADDNETRRAALVKIEQFAFYKRDLKFTSENELVQPFGKVLSVEKDAEIRLLAAEALTRIGPRASQAARQLCSSLRNDPSTPVRCQVASALSSLFDVQRESAVLFGFDELHHWDIVTLELLDGLAQDEEPRVRSEAAGALGRIVYYAERMERGESIDDEPNKSLRRRVAKQLRDALTRDESALVRAAAAFALGLCGPEATFAVPTLIEAITSDPDSGVRENALLSLGAITPGDADSIRAIRHALEEDPSPSVRMEALRVVILRIPDIAAESVELVLANEDDEDDRVQVLFAVGKLGIGARNCSAVLEKIALSDSSQKVRAAALEALRYVNIK